MSSSSIDNLSLQESVSPSQGTLKAFFSLFLMALAVYLLFLHLPELRASDEAMYADIAMDMLRNRHFLNPHFQGHPIDCFPLYSWLVAAGLALHIPTVIAVRLPALLALIGIAVESGFMARRHKDNRAGLIAMAVVLTNFASMRIGMIAQRETLNAFLLTTAWFAWYQLGPQRQHWKLAWGVALGLVTLDMTNVGLRAPLVFYLPMLLTRMPPKTRRRLQRPRHVTWLIIYSLLFYLWLQLFCDQPVLPWNSAISGSTETMTAGFWRHLVLFPWECAVYLMPWGMFIWAPFCLALQPLEPRGSSCGFFRAAAFCPALYCWLVPGQSPLMLLCALGPMAFLISMNAELLFHRYDHFFDSVIRWLCRMAAAACFAGAFFWFAYYAGRISIIPSPGSDPICNFQGKALMLCVTLIAGGIVMFYEMRRITPSYRRLAWSVSLMRFAYLAMALPIGYLAVPDRRYVAMQLQADAKNEPMPLIYSNTEGAHPVQCTYLRVPVRHISTPLNDLPQEQQVVYLLSPYHPSGMNRRWEIVSPIQPAKAVNLNQLRQYRMTPLSQFLSTRRIIITRIPNPDPNHPRFRPPEECRIYRGTLLKSPDNP